jgi:hypothetical protein
MGLLPVSGLWTQQPGGQPPNSAVAHLPHGDLRPLQLFNSNSALAKVAVFLYDRLMNMLLPSWMTTAYQRGMP